MGRLALLLALIAPVAKAQPIDTRHDSLQGYNNHIAYFGAVCVRGTTEIPPWLPGGGMTLEDISAETGVDIDLMRAWAAQRAAEMEVAVRVLSAGGESPYPDPPEPFLGLFRQDQDDCQTFVRLRNQRAAAAARGGLPDQPPPRPDPILRTEIDPEPFDTARFDRLARVIEQLPAALEAGVDPAHLQDLMSAMTGRPGIELSHFEAVPHRDAAESLALPYLVPEPRVVPDITRAELIEIARRAQASYKPHGPPLYLYYFEMLRLNTGGFGTWDLMLDPDEAFRARIGTDTRPRSRWWTRPCVGRGGVCKSP